MICDQPHNLHDPNDVHSLKGYPVSGGVIEYEASATQLLRSKSEISFSTNTTLVDSDGVDGASASDIIEYKIDLINSGTTTLRNIVVSDPILTEQLQRYESGVKRLMPLFRCG